MPQLLDYPHNLDAGSCSRKYKPEINYVHCDHTNCFLNFGKINQRTPRTRYTIHSRKLNRRRFLCGMPTQPKSPPTRSPARTRKRVSVVLNVHSPHHNEASVSPSPSRPPSESSSASSCSNTAAAALTARFRFFWVVLSMSKCPRIRSGETRFLNLPVTTLCRL